MAYFYLFFNKKKFRELINIVDISVSNQAGETPISLATVSNQVKVIDALVKKGAKPYDPPPLPPRDEFSYQEFASKLKTANEQTAVRLKAEKEAETLREELLKAANEEAELRFKEEKEKEKP